MYACTLTPPAVAQRSASSSSHRGGASRLPPLVVVGSTLSLGGVRLRASVDIAQPSLVAVWDVEFALPGRPPCRVSISQARAAATFTRGCAIPGCIACQVVPSVADAVSVNTIRPGSAEAVAAHDVDALSDGF